MHLNRNKHCERDGPGASPGFLTTPQARRIRLPIRNLRHDVRLERRVRRPDGRSRQAQFLPHQVCALGNGGGFEKRDVAVATLPTKATITGNDQLLR